MPFELHLAWISHLWPVPIAGGADIDNNPAEHLDLNNYDDVVHLFTHYIKPLYDKYHPIQQVRLKETLRYALHTFSWQDFENELESNLPPFKTPRDCRALYIQLWTLLFPTEPWQQMQMSEYIIRKDRALEAKFNEDEEGWLLNSLRN